MVGLPDEIRQVASGRALFGNGASGKLIGGTAFAFSCVEAEGTLDYLFVDEAGQVSLGQFTFSDADPEVVQVTGGTTTPGQVNAKTPGTTTVSATVTHEPVFQSSAAVPVCEAASTGRT